MTLKRNGSKGWNRSHETKVIEALTTGDCQALDFAWRTVRGSNNSARACAEIAINKYLKSGNELPLPSIDEIQKSVIAIPVVE